MKTLGAADFKAHCLAVLDAVADDGEPVLILKRGRPVARLVAVVPEGQSPQESLRGTVTMTDDLIYPALPAEAWEALGAE